uniref:Putative myb-like protein X n=1 Tax=Davidia involucrata TaxID=16924 RepID=A0A5B7CCP1_DAVIN
MEDPSVEWKIEEYSSSEDRESKVSWILDRWLGLGKKIVITGIVISSAPLVLPPLVVISAIGFAFSVPFGVIFGSYACTEKLMSKLLPGPKPSLMLEYGTVSTNEDEEEEETVGFGGEVDMGKEEVEQKDDTKGGVEMRIELVEKGSEENQAELLREDDEDFVQQGVQKDENEPMEDVDESVKEEGYEEDVGVYLDSEDKEPLEGVDVKIEGMEEEGEEGLLIEESKGDQLSGVFEKDEQESMEEVIESVKEDQGYEENVGKYLDREDKDPLEGIDVKIEGNVDSTTVKDDELPGLAEEREQNNVRRVDEIEKLCEDKKVRLGKVSGEMKGKQEESGNEAIPKENEMREMRNEANVDIVPKEVKLVGEVEDIIEGNRDGKNFDNTLEIEKTIADSNGRRLGGVVGSVVEEEQKPVVDKKAVMQRTRAKDHIAPDVDKGLQFEREKENVIHSNADLREIADESGLDLFDERNEAGDQYSYIVYENPEENENASDIAAEGSVDFLELPASAGLPQSKHAGITSETDTAIPSNKVLLNEEKIWEQIDALRTILGYKDAPHRTCIEELKALYIFTGVEPPASFKVPSDLVEVNDKLLFLMSIVGVK